MLKITWISRVVTAFEPRCAACDARQTYALADTNELTEGTWPMLLLLLWPRPRRNSISERNERKTGLLCRRSRSRFVPVCLPACMPARMLCRARSLSLSLTLFADTACRSQFSANTFHIEIGRHFVALTRSVGQHADSCVGIYVCACDSVCVCVCSHACVNSLPHLACRFCGLLFDASFAFFFAWFSSFDLAFKFICRPLHTFRLHCACGRAL